MGLLLETTHMEAPLHETLEARPMPTFLSLFVRSVPFDADK
jgi:hypothetical protein